MVITLLLYLDDIVLLAISHDDLKEQLKILHDYYSKMGMIVNIDKTKSIIIKSKNVSHDNNYLEQVTSYKYLGISFQH